MAHSRRASSTQTRFQLERLEERALLSGLAYSLTTNESNYQPGQPIQISLTVTNTSSQPIETSRGPRPRPLRRDGERRPGLGIGIVYPASCCVGHTPTRAILHGR